MKFKKGDKIILKSKYGAASRIYESSVYRYLKKHNQPYAYVNDYIFHTVLKRWVYVINENFTTDGGGDYFDEIDLEYYKIYERKLKLQKLYESR